MPCPNINRNNENDTKACLTVSDPFSKSNTINNDTARNPQNTKEAADGGWCYKLNKRKFYIIGSLVLIFILVVAGGIAIGSKSSTKVEPGRFHINIAFTFL